MKDKGMQLIPWICLIGGLAAVGLFRLCRNDRAAMNWWLDHVSMPYKRFVSGLTDHLPFSTAEVLCTLAGVLILALAVQTIWKLARHAPVNWAGRLVGVCAFAVWVYAAVCAFWGTQYYGESFAEKTGLQAQAVSPQTLRAVTFWFRDRVNETAGNVPRDENGLFAVSAEEILQRADGIYVGMQQQYPALAGPDRKIKKAAYSKLMSLAGFTGYIFPLAGETTVNADCPAALIPATVTHEISHQRGVAPEQEANFCAVRAAELSGDAVYEYSGWLFGYIHLYNALLRIDQDSALEAARGLCPQALTDLADNSAYWDARRGFVKTAAQSNYSAFIRGYGQTLGMASYGACVDLLALCYGEKALQAYPAEEPGTENLL